MSTTSIVVTLIVLGLLVACQGQFDFGVPIQRAAIEPVDSLVFVGETLKLQCSLTDTTAEITSESMYFKISPNNTLSWIVPQENITVVNESTIYAFVEITDDFSNMTTVACWSKNIVSESLKSVYILAEKPIKNITDFSGVYVYFSRGLELTWSLGESYLSDANINVTVDWSANGPPNKRGSDCDKETKESCRIPIRGQDIIFVRITVNYIASIERPRRDFLEPLYDRSATSVIKVFVDDHIKTQPPEKLRESGINSTCVQLTWNEPLYFRSCECPPIYMVNVTDKHNRSNTYLTEPELRPMGQDYISVCSLTPYSTYEMSVQIKPQHINPWSDLASIEVTTAQASPLTGPPLTSTSYHVEECVENKMDVTVYWNDQLKSSLQGELTKFEVVIGNVTDLLRKGSNYFKKKLNCDTEHRILVYSATVVGTSISPSDIIIPSSSAELAAVSDLRIRMEETQASSVTHKSVNFKVTWDAGLLAERNVTLVLYVCQGASVPYTCFNDFITTEINVDKNEMLVEDLEKSMTLFGYALKDDQGGKRGIQWIECVYRAEQIPSRPAPVSVNVGKAPNTLEISWTSRRCDRETKVLILRYHLFICRQNIKLTDQQPCRVTTINSSSNSTYRYIAKDLPGGSTYDVSIQAESPAGLGLTSIPMLGVPDVGNSNQEHVLDVVMGTLSAMICASIVIICFARQCLRSRKKVMSMSRNKYNIFKNEKPLQPQANGKCNIDTAASQTPGLEMSLEKPIVPPALIPKSTVDVIHQTLSDPTDPVDNSNEVANDTQTDNIKDTMPNIATHIDTREPQVTCAQDVSDAGQSLDLTSKVHEYLHSDSANPYVKMTNECFSSGSDNLALAVDEGYNSPEVEIDSPEFLVDTSHTLLTDVSAVPPLCMNGLVPFFSPQSQDVFKSMAFSNIPAEAEKLLPESSLSLISPQSEISKTGLSINSPQSEISKTGLSINSPQSEISKTGLSINSPQSEISKTGFSINSTQSEISKTGLSINSPQSQISETNVSTMLSTASLYPNWHELFDKHTKTNISLKPMVTTNSSSVIHVYHVNNPSPHHKQSLPPLCELPQAVNFNSSNSPAATSDSNLSTVSFQCNKNSPELDDYYIPGSNLPARPQIESCNKKKDIPLDSSDVCNISGNRSGLSRGDNSNQQMLSGYVTCAIDGVMNLKAMDADLRHGSTNSEDISSLDYETSQNLHTPDGSQCASAGYKSLEFLENIPEPDSSIQGRFGTVEEDSVDQTKFGSHITDYASQDRSVAYKWNFDHQNRLAHLVNNSDGGDADVVDSYVTCAVNGEVNFQKVNSHLEDEPVASLDRCSDYTPNCRTNVHMEDEIVASLDRCSDYTPNCRTNVHMEDEIVASLDRCSDYTPNCRTNVHMEDEIVASLDRCSDYTPNCRTNVHMEDEIVASLDRCSDYTPNCRTNVHMEDEIVASLDRCSDYTPNCRTNVHMEDEIVASLDRCSDYTPNCRTNVHMEDEIVASLDRCSDYTPNCRTNVHMEDEIVASLDRCSDYTPNCRTNVHMEDEIVASLDRCSDYTPNCRTNVHMEDEIVASLDRCSDYTPNCRTNVHMEDEIVASLDRCSDYTPNCRTNVHTQDAFSDNKSDNYISQSICSEVGLTCTALENKDDSQDACEGYRDFSFLEHFHGNQEKVGTEKEKVGTEKEKVGTEKEKVGTEKDDCIQQAGLEIQEEGLGHQGELEMHNNFVNEGRLSIEKNNDDVDPAQTFDFVRSNVAHEDSNLRGKFSLQPTQVGDHVWEMLNVSPRQTTSADSSFELNDLESNSADSSFELNDLDSNSADATIDQFISEGGYVSQVQFSTPVQSSNSHC